MFRLLSLLLLAVLLNACKGSGGVEDPAGENACRHSFFFHLLSNGKRSSAGTGVVTSKAILKTPLKHWSMY